MVRFEVGKWYKGQKNNYYFKFLHLERGGEFNKIFYTERIYSNKYEKVEINNFDYITNNDFEVYALNNPVTIEELQRLLPKNHPDLLTKIYEVW